MSMARSEKECNRREDMLKQEISDLQKVLSCQDTFKFLDLARQSAQDQAASFEVCLNYESTATHVRSLCDVVVKLFAL